MSRSSARSRPSASVIILVAGVLLMLPSLRSGFMMDDYFHLPAMGGSRLEASSDRHIFTFVSGNAEINADMARRGHLPWWVDDHLRLVFLRPLSSLLSHVDAAVFGRWAAGHHLHSLLWWALALLTAGVLLRRLLPGSAGILAFLLFALDESHILPAAWIANRSALVALAAMLLGLRAHVRWREESWRAGRFLAPAAIVLGLLAGEVAVLALAYFLAYELWGAPPSSRQERLRAWLSFLVPGAVYLVVYLVLGYGAARSGLYLDPTADPWGFLVGAAQRIPILLAGGITGFSADFGIMDARLRPALIAAGCGGGLLLGGLLRAVWKQTAAATRRRLRWLLAGGSLALVPAAAVYPSDRMFLVPSLGLVAAIAVILHQAWLARRGRYAPRRILLLVGGGYLAVVHLLLAPLVVELYQKSLIDFNRASLAVSKSPWLVDTVDRENIILLAPDSLVGLYLPLLVSCTQEVTLPIWRPLTLAPWDHQLRRPRPRTLELEVAPGGRMLRSWAEEIYRDKRHMLLPGDVLERGPFRVEILDGSAAGPTRVAFHFDRDLDDPSLLFLNWEEGALRKATLPEVGGEIQLKRTAGPAGC